MSLHSCQPLIGERCLMNTRYIFLVICCYFLTCRSSQVTLLDTSTQNHQDYEELIKKEPNRWLEELSQKELIAFVAYVLSQESVEEARKIALLSNILSLPDTPTKELSGLFTPQTMPLLCQLPPRIITPLVLDIFFHNFNFPSRDPDKIVRQKGKLLHYILFSDENSSESWRPEIPQPEKAYLSFLNRTHGGMTLMRLRNYWGICPRLLHQAVLCNEIKEEYRLYILKELLQRGLDPNTRDIFGRTALFYAVMTDNYPCTTLLLKHGTDITIQDDAPRIKSWRSIEYSKHIILGPEDSLSYLRTCLFRPHRFLLERNPHRDILGDAQNHYILDDPTHHKTVLWYARVLQLANMVALFERHAEKNHIDLPEDAEPDDYWRYSQPKSLMKNAIAAVTNHVMSHRLSIQHIPGMFLHHVATHLLEQTNASTEVKTTWLQKLVEQPALDRPAFASTITPKNLTLVHELPTELLVPLAIDIFFYNWLCYFEYKNVLLRECLSEKREGISEKQRDFLRFLLETNSALISPEEFYYLPVKHDGQICPRLLHEAVLCAIPDTEIRAYILTELLARGLEVNALDVFGRTALFYAVLQNDDTCAHLLLEQGADKTISDEAPEQPTSIEAIINQANRALIHLHGTTQKEMLGDENPWLYTKPYGNICKRTPLEYARQFELTKMIHVLEKY